MEDVVGLSFFLYRMRSIIQKYLLMKKIYQNIDSFLWNVMWESLKFFSEFSKYCIIRLSYFGNQKKS